MKDSTSLRSVAAFDASMPEAAMAVVIARVVLQGGDLAGDLLGRLGGLRRERFPLGRDHGQAPAGIA
jgi:hypothetical protein